MLNSLTENCRAKIGTQTATSFQFIHGWTIYFDYFLMRGFGNSEEQAQQSVAANYSITYEDCERVFNMLRNTQEIAGEVDSINAQWKEIIGLMTKLTEGINQLNSTTH